MPVLLQRLGRLCSTCPCRVFLQAFVSDCICNAAQTTISLVNPTPLPHAAPTRLSRTYGVFGGVYQATMRLRPGAAPHARTVGEAQRRILPRLQQSRAALSLPFALNSHSAQSSGLRRLPLDNRSREASMMRDSQNQCGAQHICSKPC